MPPPETAIHAHLLGRLTEARLLEVLATGVPVTDDRKVVVADVGHPSEVFADLCDDLRAGGIPFRVASLGGGRREVLSQGRVLGRAP
jgi:hypothetical protein